MPHKVCPKCKEDKVFSCFFKNISRKDGMSTYCKICTMEANRKYVSLEKRRELGSKWRLENPDKAKAKRDRIPKEKANEYRRRWDKANVEKNSAYQKLRIETLADCYICSAILGRPVKDVPKELIEAKRIQIKIQRLLKNGDQ